MNYDEFREVVNSIFLYFRNKDKPDSRQMQMWYDECRNIPAEAREFIFDRMKKETGLPFNLPKVITQHYSQWESERKRTDMKSNRSRATEFCMFCYDTGYLEIKCERNNYKWTVMVRCGHCGISQFEDWDTDKPYKDQPSDVHFKAMPRLTVDGARNWCDRLLEKGIKAKLFRFEMVEEHFKKTGMTQSQYQVKQGKTIQRNLNQFTFGQEVPF